MDLGIEGRVALVTASSKGLGRASALALADEGCKLVVCARGEEALRATEKEVSNRTEVLALVEDVTEPDAPRRLVAATIERFGTVDIVVPNAGVRRRLAPSSSTTSSWPPLSTPTSPPPSVWRERRCPTCGPRSGGESAASPRRR